ncbi:carboxypeptidase-like regulatory domain-containing protein [Nocardioides sp.]|uniref:MSCRAMM family protein n=1 Tax=Nocardioides sp. TaxID=35761 RepID=UPI0032197B53
MGTTGAQRTSRGSRRGLASALALVLLLLALVPAPAAHAADKGRVRGEIIASGGGTVTVKLLWFDNTWGYLGARKFRGGAYSLSLAPGTYYLQAVDQAPAYDVTKNRPSTVKVTVRSGKTTVKSIKMRRGASIGGTVKAGGKVARKARVVAANTDEQSFETTADKKGNFALGGLPPGKYSVFTYDRKASWVGKSVYLPKVKGKKFTPVSIALTQKAGGLLVDLYAGKKALPGTAFVTAVSRRTGQFWTAKSRRGSVTFEGLYPGAYDLQVPGSGNYLPARLTVKATVKPGRVAFGSARLTKRGAWVTGTVVDENNPAEPLAGAAVRLLDSGGNQVAADTADSSGRFTLDGQLMTQKGMTVVAGPGPNSPYLGQDLSYCKYDTTKVRNVKVTTGKRTSLGTVALPHLPNEQQDGLQCWTVTDVVP